MAATHIQSNRVFHYRQGFREAVYKILVIAKKDIISNLLNFKIFLALATLTITLLISAHLLALDHKQRLDNWTTNQEAQLDPVTGGVVRYNLPDGKFFYSTGTGHDAPIRPPQPLSVLIKGLDDDLHRSVAIGQRIGFGPRQDENAQAALFGSLDTLFVVKLIVSLLALFFSLDTMTREKETGTLTTLLAYPLRRRELILGKALGVSVSLFVPLAIAYLCEIFFLYSVHGLLRSQEELIRVTLIFCLSLLYGLLFVDIGVLISTITSKTKTAVVIALLVWGALVFILPSASILVAKLVVSAPSYNELNARLYKNQQQIIQAELKAHPGAQTIFDLPNAKQVIFQILDADRQITDNYITRTSNQFSEARRFAMMLPTGALSFGSSDLANTGTQAYQSYLSFLQSGRDSVIDALKRGWDMRPGEGAKLMQEVMQDITSRQYEPEPLSVNLRSAAKASISIIVWSCLVGLIALWRVERYDLR